MESTMREEPVLFDVSLIALAHAGAPVSESALRYVRRAVDGDLEAVAPCVAVVGAHHVLRNYYRFSAERASYALSNFLIARRIHWYGDASKPRTQAGLDQASRNNIEAWDGYYAAVAKETGATTVLSLDDDFERVDGLTVEQVLTPREHRRLNEYVAQLAS